ncbi:uncharacterized protein LOC114170690 isoform X2 [Vigna unguiculata]|uniref:uncharacterized protein LOC114170690 isoform X2 n=1 Tax=Vigna unguiculata TaxID=3917 RepID=UPI0010163FD6|nr:uncharacterized protein LOC114170690 isoform X2 [Vigna unguiculata]
MSLITKVGGDSVGHHPKFHRRRRQILSHATHTFLFFLCAQAQLLLPGSPPQSASTILVFMSSQTNWWHALVDVLAQSSNCYPSLPLKSVVGARVLTFKPYTTVGLYRPEMLIVACHL